MKKLASFVIIGILSVIIMIFFCKERRGDGNDEIRMVLSEGLNSIKIPSTSARFIARDKFKVDTNKAEIRISYLGNNFKEWFLGKVEDPFPGRIIYGHKLEKNSIDSLILKDLGGNDAAETTLTELWTALAIQSKSENSVLSWANIFYIKDINGTLCAVCVCWGGNGWHMDAYSVEDPDEWGAVGYLVFSHNS